MKWKKKFDTQLYYSVTLLKIKNKVFLPKNFITVLLYLKGKMNNERDLKLQRAQFYCNNLLFALGWNKLDCKRWCQINIDIDININDILIIELI